MTRGTTPTLRLRLQNKDGSAIALNLSECNLYVTLEQGCIEQTFTNDDIEIEDNVILLRLSQLNTLGFQKGSCKVQVRGTFEGDAFATNTVTTQINGVLLNGEIE